VVYAAAQQSANSVAGGRSFKKLLSSYNAAVALEASTGNAYAWGLNTVGILGNNTANTNFSANASSPISVFGGRSYSQLAIDFGALYIGGHAAVAIEGSTGNAYVWGLGNEGALGNNTTNNASSPTSVFGGRSFKQVAIGYQFVAALEGSTGNAYCWGLAEYGNLGNNTANSASSPTSVAGGRSFSQIIPDATYGECVIAIEGSTGHAWAWGGGFEGGLGNNSTASASSPVSVLGGRSYKQIVNCGGDGVFGSILAIEASTGNLYAWGNNSQGQLGINSIANASSPTSVVGGRSFTTVVIDNAIATTVMAIEGSTGNLYAWGYNNKGQLGNNSIISASSPVSVFGGRSYSQVYLNGPYISGTTVEGSVVQAIEASTGNLYAWGYSVGPTGAIGGSSVSQSSSSPISVAGGRSYSQLMIDASSIVGTYGNIDFLAVEGSTGHAYGWGQNVYGQLGNNVASLVLSPISTASIPNI
jgi:alpha-tubulin suppressor-like RCC1 family protein